MTENQHSETAYLWVLKFVTANTGVKEDDIDLEARMRSGFVHRLILDATLELGVTLKIDLGQPWSFEKLVDLIAKGLEEKYAKE